jgi:anti-repressor protein
MKNNIQLFQYEEKPVRTITINGELWWVAKDVCAILNLSDVSMSVSRLDEDEKGTSQICTPGGKQTVLVINESGLYNLVLRSEKPEAKKFKKWITSEVLPSIRKTGKYEVTAKSDDELILIGYEKLIERVKLLTPKAESHDRYLSAENAEDMAVVAQKLYGDRIGRNKLYKILRESGILKHDNTPYQDYMQYFKVITKPQPMGDKVINIPVTLVKPEGVDFIMRKVEA